ncbi:ribonuclease domain-containing protein [Xanthomonas sp. NCPPB 3005]|uniref:ribonuclease domain-containing protein n=1 Tax=Xanthomonas sp. NCPPB 3005 TaxID=3240913 RepID=UPI0035116D42
MYPSIRFTLLAALALSAAQAQAQKAPSCGTLPTYVREAVRDLNYCITMPNPIAACGAGAVDVQVFGNNERRLPQAGRGQTYDEGKARHDPGVPAGTYRPVFLVTDGAKKSVVDKRYHSADHYVTFCTIS